MLSSDIRFTVIITTLLILLLIAVVIITIFVSNRRNAQQEVKMAQMQVDHEKGLRTTEQEVQVNIAMDLHDNIGQLLRVTQMQLDQQLTTNPEKLSALKPIRDSLTQAIDEVRRIGRSLNTDLLDKKGLINAIEQESERLRQLNKYTIHWENDEIEPRLNKDEKMIAFRIFQEMVNNILKHSDASNIYINLHGNGPFCLAVGDDGKGFDVDEMMRSPKGAGLKNMAKRAGLTKMVFNIDTSIGKGTTFTLKQTTEQNNNA